MDIRIDRKDLFLEKLIRGINLFTGAGFSCLPNEKNERLPIAEELCKELCNKFDLPYDVFGNDLESICALTDTFELQSFLREKFTVESINEKYYILNRIHLLSYITTNIDNIIHLITEKDSRYYLRSLAYYGATRKEKNELRYVPLHGEVANKEKLLYFSKFDLSTVESSNSDLFQQARLQLLNSATLFWGYGFHDSGVLKTVKKLLEHGPHDIWIQCLPNNYKQIKLFEKLGCNIITATTEELFDWIDEKLDKLIEPETTKNIINNSKLEQYAIPSVNKVPAVQAADFYKKGMTQWYSILMKQAVELDIVNDVYNKYLTNKNVIIVGPNYSGKTTALMQLALKIDCPNKMYIETLTKEKCKFILKNIQDAEVTIFVDNCENDMEAYKILADSPTIKTIATASDYTFEGAKHILGDVHYLPMFIEDLSRDQAQRFYNSIDKTLRHGVFNYKDSESEKFSILEMMLKNISNFLGEDKIKDLLEKMLKNNYRAFETVALTIYLSANNSALSTDILFSYFNCKSYEESRTYVAEANGLLRDLDIKVDICDDDQDYYDVRSKLFLYHVRNILSDSPRFTDEYAKVIENFLKNVSIYKIYDYHLFKRSAYDADLYYKLFNNKSNAIYQDLYEYDPNPYTLQQWALCKAKLGDFKSAFSFIDQALRQKPNNFSIENTSAIILFEANKQENNVIGRQKREEAMKILERCYNNDKRKLYHANRFAEFAIAIYEMDNNYQYIQQAREWLDEIMSSVSSNSRFTKKYDKKLNEIIRIHEQQENKVD